MKNTRITIILLFMLAITACQKEQPITTVNPTEQTRDKKENSITIEEAQQWLTQQSSTAILKKYPIRWENAKDIPTETGNRIVLKIPGQPTVQKYRQGYRQLSIQRNPETNQIEGKFLEIIPDALYFQGRRKIDKTDFTGRIFEFDLSYRLTKGSIYAGGKLIGESRPAIQSEKTAYQNSNTKLNQLGSFSQNETTTAHGKIALAKVIENCQWVQSSYVDSEGYLVIHSDRYCTTFIIDDGGGGNNGYNDGGIDPGQYQGGGGGGSTSSPAPPPPSNLPGENANRVDPKKMVECFSGVKTEGAAFQVKLLVVEPFPGTSFNVGPNSFGHVAVQLTKVNGSQSVTQVMGFYPTGSGLDKLISPSAILDNSDIEFNMEASYFTDAASFQKILDFVSTPTSQYHYTDYNCAKFAYEALKAGSINVPDPTTSFGMPVGAFSGGRGMSPAGMASALRSQKAADPSIKNISEGGGRAPASKGECK